MSRACAVGEAFRDASRRLSEAGVVTARLDARLLVEHVLGEAPGAALGQRERILSADQDDHLRALLGRRLRREPWARIVGKREFWSLPFRVGEATLVPRPDSETLIEAALAWARGRRDPLRVLDLGTGCGCLLLAVLSELGQAQGVGVDISAAALDTARHNAEALGLGGRARFVRGHWGDALKGPFDMVLANPPYIASADIEHLEPEVAAYEPREALDGGADGLDAYRALAPGLAPLMAPLMAQGAAAFIEVGAGQAPAVAGILTGNRLSVVRTESDLAAIDRCVVAVPNIP